MYTGPQRKRNRLENYDYSQNGYYFVTICVKNRECVFGEIVDGKMFLNEYGNIAKQEILETEKIRKEIIIDEFIVMPNHLHILVVIQNNSIEIVGNTGPCSLQNPCSLQKMPHKNTLSNCIQRIKSQITRNIRKQFDDFTFSWQKSFYDVIIKNEDQLLKTREYIQNNPLKWELDTENPENTK